MKPNSGNKQGKFNYKGPILAGRYRIIGKLGNGSMGIVYKAEDLAENGKIYALKLLHPYLANDENMLKRFQSELALARALDHKSIVKTYNVGQLENGQLYLLMEYVGGLSLRQYIDHKAQESNNLGGLPFNSALFVLYQLLQGAHYAHSLNIIHRDLKPANIMISSGGEIKIIDFGTAKRLDVLHNITTNGELVGTAQYISPEQINGEKLGVESDIYALGIIAHELVSGSAPFSAATVVGLALMHLTNPIPDLKNTVDFIPDWYKDLIQKATQKDPKRRFKSAAQFAAVIEHHAPHFKNYQKIGLRSRSSKIADCALQKIHYMELQQQHADIMQAAY